jgi:hypothetical protein
VARHTRLPRPRPHPSPGAPFQKEVKKKGETSKKKIADTNKKKNGPLPLRSIEFKKIVPFGKKKKKEKGTHA